MTGIPTTYRWEDSRHQAVERRFYSDPDGKTFPISIEPNSQDQVFNVNTIANGDNIGQVDWTNQLFSHYYYIKDHLGDVRMIMDENGNAQVWNNYYPFGEEMPGLNTVNAGPDDRYGFTSKELDAETGLDYFGSRYYDSWAGRFNSIDPHADLYHSWSPYAYSLDNPVLLVDQTGMDPGNNNNQGNQTTSNWNWQYGPDNTIHWFNTGSSSDQTQVSLTLSQQSQSNPASISANGFAGLSSSKGMTGIVKSLGSLGESYDYVTTGVGLLGKVLSSQGLRDFSSEMGNYAFAANLFAALPTLSKVATGKRSLTAGTAYDVVTPFVATEIGSAIGTDGTSLLVGLGFQEAKGAYDFLKYTVTPKLVQIQESLMSLPERMMGGAQ